MEKLRARLDAKRWEAKTWRDADTTEGVDEAVTMFPEGEGRHEQLESSKLKGGATSQFIRERARGFESSEEIVRK
jgi:hypothetical protein